MKTYIKIKFWWSEDRTLLFVTTNDGMNETTVSLTREEASLISMNAYPDEDARADAEIKAFNLHTALQSLLYSYTKLVKATNSEPTFGEAPGIGEANKALYDNRPLADWEPPTSSNKSVQ